MWHVWEAGVWWGDLMKRTISYPRRSWEHNIKTEIQEVGCGGMDGFIWLRIGSGGGLL
jgi:hypothetical protein